MEDIRVAEGAPPSALALVSPPDVADALGGPEGAPVELGTIEKKATPATRARDARAARGEVFLHLVVDVRFGRDRRATCSCGAKFEGRSDEHMAALFARHLVLAKSLLA